MKPELLASIDQYYEHFNYNLEGEMLASLINLYQVRVGDKAESETIKNTNVKEIAMTAYSSIFASKLAAQQFVERPNRLKIDGDKLYRWALSYVEDQKKMGDKYVKVEDAFDKNTRLFLDGLRKSQPQKSFYPDANSTMRLTYGKVDTLPFRTDRRYYGVKENYYTDMDGLIAKYKKGDEEFDLPKQMLKLYKKKQYGKYTDKAGYMPVNFLTDNDITGGNSGSPVINGDGHLIGLAFDGNSEALSGDIVFEPKWQKTINVDVRFVLWIIDEYAGAKNLIEEMTIIE